MEKRNRRIRDRQRDEYADYYDEEAIPNRTNQAAKKERQDRITLPAWSLHLFIMGLVGRAYKAGGQLFLNMFCAFLDSNVIF